MVKRAQLVYSKMADPEEIEEDDQLNCLVIPLKKLKMGALIRPRTKVYRAEWKTRKRAVAVKVEGELCVPLANRFSSLNHKNIVNLIGVVFEPPTDYCFVMDLCDKGSLFDYIHIGNNRLDLDLALDLSKGISGGLRYLHNDIPDAPYVHRKLTSYEVLLQNVKGVLVPKISGMITQPPMRGRRVSAGLDRGKTHDTLVMSPEQINGLETKCPTDIYSVGMIMYELVSREVPFDGIQLYKAIRLITQEKERPSIPPSCPEELADLIQDCWKHEPEERPTATQVEAKLDVITNNRKAVQEQHTGTDAGPALNAAAAGETHVQTSQQGRTVKCCRLL